MPRYRLQPTREQETTLLRHCSDARYVWNLAVEQHAWWRPGRDSAPGYLEQSRQLTAARAGNPWLAGGSQTVQQQALRDFARAMTGFFARTHGRPSWRKAGRDEGLRVTGPQRGGQDGAEPGDLPVGLGAAGAPAGGQGPGPGREGAGRVHEPAVLGVRARGREVAREPSALPVHGLRIRRQRRRERGPKHRGGARRESAARRRR
jgi:hypothetical protein